MIKNLFKNLLTKAEQDSTTKASLAEQNAKDYTDTLSTNIVTVSLTGTYITSGEVKYIQAGNLVVFSAKFVPKQNITSSVGQCYASTPLPTPIYTSTGSYLITNGPGSSDSGDASRRTAVNSSGLYPLGAYTSGVTYYVCGAYICEVSA